MNLLQVLRYRIFWFFDFFRGGVVKKKYKDIQYIIENSGLHIPETKKKTYLIKLLAHAVSTSPFYKKYSNYTSITDFPIINKNMIRDFFMDFKSSAYTAENCTVISTSGSTGTPFSVLQDKHKRYRNTADNLYFSKRSGYQIGQYLVYIKIESDAHKRTILSKLWFQNVYPQSIFRLQDRDIEKLIVTLKKSGCEKSFLGYTSAFEKICRYLDKINSDPIDCNMVSIITMSEALNEYTYEAMKKYFGVAPVSRYSNNENGILAQQDRTGSTKFIINSASYYLEIFDMDMDVLAAHGTHGRIVVTDLHNYAMPLIRYDTGDIGVLGVDENNVPFLKSIEGRKLDLIYDTRGNIVPSHISYKLCKYGDYKQFQLVQYGEKAYLIKLNTDTKVDEVAMIQEYKGYFGQDAIITIQYVEEIPLLSSGKRREVRNTYHSQL